MTDTERPAVVERPTGAPLSLLHALETLASCPDAPEWERCPWCRVTVDVLRERLEDA